MWLRSLHVENFRGFAALDIEFDEHMTLVLGGNGAGKTSLLDAIVVALGAFTAKIPQGPSVGIDADDARRVVFELGRPPIPDFQEQWPVVLRASARLSEGLQVARAQIGGPASRLITWSRDREDRSGRTSRADDRELRDLVSVMHYQVMAGDEELPLPLIAYYGTQRLWREKRATAGRTGRSNRFDGYNDCLDIASSERFLRDWMRQKTQEEVQQQQANPGYRHPQLRAMIRAVEQCVEGLTGFGFDLMHDEIRMRIGSAFQSFSMLSDGYRNMIAMVADLAERAAVLNPQFGERAAQETSGIVLIDELELHLHPAWQRTVVPSLRRTFPNLQFIAATHSPQILASVERTQVRILRDSQVIATEAFVEGRDASELLVDVFGAGARPEQDQRELDELFRLLDQESYAAARTKLATLEGRYGPNDAAMIRARWILATEDASNPTDPATSAAS